MNRRAIGFDIDPLAVLISTVKTTPLDAVAALRRGQDVAASAENRIANDRKTLKIEIEESFDCDTRGFIDYWFSEETQLELMGLLSEIRKVKRLELRRFLQLCFSAIIITKSGGVSLAWDLAHTRPHKLRQGQPKSHRPAIPDFLRRLKRNVSGLGSISLSHYGAQVELGSAEVVKLNDESIDLLFTSPPYASNAIDYMRASKFSLVWLGYAVNDLTVLRSKYIGGENVRDFQMEELPSRTSEVVARITAVNKKRGAALKRYYSEMRRVLTETNRVLKPDRTAVFVVGSAVMAGIDSEAQNCLGEIGREVGLDFVNIGIRRLDRNRRMMPVTMQRQTQSQIENRMHEEYIVGFYKPAKSYAQY